jgi:hypothetical protein
MPRGIPNSPIDTTDQDVGQKTHTDIPGEGILDRSAIHEEGIEIVTVKALDGYAGDLAFMEELVEVEVHESSDPNAEPIVDLYCNGIPQRLIRGRAHTVKRKYVHILARARQVSMSTETRVEGENVVNRVNKRSALRYPFSVMRDDNPRGRDWLRQELQAA